MPRNQHDKTRQRVDAARSEIDALDRRLGRDIRNSESNNDANANAILERVEQLERRLEQSIGGIAAQLMRIEEALPAPSELLEAVAVVQMTRAHDGEAAIKGMLEYIALENDKLDEQGEPPLVVELEYTKVGASIPEVRHVEPREVRVGRGGTFLHAFDMDRQNPRNFTLDGIARVTFESVVG